MDPNAPLILPCGDQALSVQLSEDIDEAVSERIIALDQALREAEVGGVIETVPTYRALLVHYDPERVRGRALEDRLRTLCATIEGRPVAGRLWRVPVRYGGEVGEDLDAMAAERGMTPEAMIALHAGATYRIYMIGFAPGFTYLGGVPKALHTPRLAVPRQRVEAGAVGIGGRQGAITSLPGPSGWRYIGRTPVRLFDPARNPPVLFAAGDRVIFEPVDGALAARLFARAGDAMKGGTALIAPERME